MFVYTSHRPVIGHPLFTATPQPKILLGFPLWFAVYKWKTIMTRKFPDCLANYQRVRLSSHIFVVAIGGEKRRLRQLHSTHLAMPRVFVVAGVVPRRNGLFREDSCNKSCINGYNGPCSSIYLCNRLCGS